MKRLKDYRKIVFPVFITSVLCLTIYYLMISTNLIIKGYNTVDKHSWDIHFENLREKTFGTAKVIRKPFIDKKRTHIGDYEISLKKPGDYVVYTFDVVNKGNLDARLKHIMKLDLKCKSAYNIIDDEAIVCENLKYTLKYENDSEFMIGHELNKNERITLKLKLEYTGNKLPKKSVNIRGLDIILLYNQK